MQRLKQGHAVAVLEIDEAGLLEPGETPANRLDRQPEPIGEIRAGGEEMKGDGAALLLAGRTAELAGKVKQGRGDPFRAVLRPSSMVSACERASISFSAVSRSPWDRGSAIGSRRVRPRVFRRIAVPVTQPQADEAAGTDQIDDLAPAIRQGLRGGNTAIDYAVLRGAGEAFEENRGAGRQEGLVLRSHPLQRIPHHSRGRRLLRLTIGKH